MVEQSNQKKTTTASKKKLSEQKKDYVNKKSEEKEDTIFQPYEGNFEKMISTGSTLLDLAISGGRKRGGGIPAGIFIEIFGSHSSGKTVMLSEIAGAVQRQGGQVMFHDPEARLNKQFAMVFDLNPDEIAYSTPDKIPEIFSQIRSWKPEKKDAIHGIFADSLAALSTDMEMDNDDGDKMGMRRSKEFSEELRKTCRILSANNYLMVASNQVRINIDGGSFAPKYRSPGGESIGFYSSLRLKTRIVEKLKKTVETRGKKVTGVYGVKIDVEVFKNSTWKPYRTAPLTIIFDYGIDKIRDNLQFIKDYTDNTNYTLSGEKISGTMDKAIEEIEKNNWEEKLDNEVIDLWWEIEKKFESDRKKKKR